MAMHEHDPQHDQYVTCSDWTAPAGRADLIDEIADQYERRACNCTGAALQRAS